MTCYNFWSDDWLWDAYKEVLEPYDVTLDEPLRERVAEAVAEEHDCEQTRQRAERILEEIDTWE